MLTTMNTTPGFLYWEDFEPGQTYELGSYEVSREEILSFARHYDPQPFHIDEEAARATHYGGLIASGWHTGAISQRLYVQQLLSRSACLGSPGIEEIRFFKPVRPGDVLHCRLTVLEQHPSRSRPERGSVVVKTEIENQEGEVVFTMTSRVLFTRREPAKPGVA
jgi:acyl dehydratase